MVGKSEAKAFLPYDTETVESSVAFGKPFVSNQGNTEIAKRIIN